MEKVEKFVGEIFAEVTFQMDDNHAWYFDAKDQGEAVEVKVEKDEEAISYRKEGNEDWIYCSTL